MSVINDYLLCNDLVLYLLLFACTMGYEFKHGQLCLLTKLLLKMYQARFFTMQQRVVSVFQNQLLAIASDDNFFDL